MPPNINAVIVSIPIFLFLDMSYSYDHQSLPLRQSIILFGIIPHLITPLRSKLLSRLIKTESVGKDRTRLTKAIALAVRELAKQTEVTGNAKDLAAFIALALQTISDGIDVSVAAWEKRDYWVKADRFRMEWMWTGQIAEKMRKALSEDDWATIAMLMPQIAAKLNKIQVSERHRLGKPWVGAYKRMNEEILNSK